MNTNLSANELFSKGRTCNKFLDKEVPTSMLTEIYDLMKLGPTSANCSPLRILFVTSKSKERLMPHIAEGNKDKVISAPVTAIFASDLEFTNKIDKLFPVYPEIKNFFESSNEVLQSNALRNSTLQAAYFMVIARSFGLDCGPMSGFDANGIKEEFFKYNKYEVNFICNLGYKAEENPYPRLPRLDFNEVCQVL